MMFDLSQTGIKHLSNSRCNQHPDFDIDTICFNQACRRHGKQIICSYCGQEQPHFSHTHEQFPIYKTSPGFRLIDLQSQSSYLKDIQQQRQVGQQSIAKLRTFLTDLIDQISRIYDKKIECFTDFFQQKSIFKICNKIRHNFQEHLDCCVPIVNNFKDFEDGKTQNLLKVQLIMSKVRNETQQLYTQVNQAIIDLKKRFYKKQNELIVQQTNVQEKGLNLQQILYQIDNSGHSIINKTSINKKHDKNFQISTAKAKYINLQGSSQSLMKSLIDQLVVFDKKLIKDEDIQIIQKQAQRNKLIGRLPIGFDMLSSDTIVIWNASKQAIEQLPKMTNIKHLVIEDSSIAKQKDIQKIMKIMPKLTGIHFHCECEVSTKIQQLFTLKYLSFYPNYRFIQQIDRSKYFPRQQRTMLDHIPCQLLKKMQQNTKRKNIYITRKVDSIDQMIDEFNFVQNQSDIYWVFRTPMLKTLFYAKNILILVFSNIAIDGYICFREIYQQYKKLHTIVFDDCIANHNRLAYQFRYLKNQLIHLQISGDNLDKKITLSQDSVYQICRQTNLETLILNNVQMTSQRQSSKVFPLNGIQNLAKLVHLNLFNSWPIYSGLFSKLHKNCKKNLRFLNIGCSQIRWSGAYMYNVFPKLESLSIDYTQITEGQLIKLLYKRNVQYLSMENMNGQRIIYQQNSANNSIKRYYGLITPSFFQNLKDKDLKYVNIYNCHSFSEYEWEGFDQLQCIRVNEGLLSKKTIQSLTRRGVKIHSQESNLCQPSLSNKEKDRATNEIDISSSNQHLTQKHVNTYTKAGLNELNGKQQAHSLSDSKAQQDDNSEAQDSLFINSEEQKLSQKIVYRQHKRQTKYFKNEEKQRKNYKVQKRND